MKKIFFKHAGYFAFPILAFVILTGGVVWAATSPNDSSSATTTEPTQTTTLPDRIALRVATYKVSLSTTQQKAVASKCVVVQAKLKSIQTKDLTSFKERQATYTELTTKLNSTIDNLKSQSLDSSELRTVAGKFDSAVSQYTNDAASYTTTLEDIISMDCGSGPTGFEATLLDARLLRTQLSKDAQLIKDSSVAVTENLNNTKQELTKSSSGTN
jgi:hypothetical protein